MALFSGGTIFLALGLYLAYWVRTRQGRSLAFWFYSILITISVLMFVPRAPSVPYMHLIVYLIMIGGLVLLVAAPLVLRAEIISLYRRSWDIKLPINPLLTILFSSVYLNYSIPDLPVSPAATITATKTA